MYSFLFLFSTNNFNLQLQFFNSYFFSAAFFYMQCSDSGWRPIRARQPVFLLNIFCSFSLLSQRRLILNSNNRNFDGEYLLFAISNRLSLFRSRFSPLPGVSLLQRGLFAAPRQAMVESNYHPFLGLDS